MASATFSELKRISPKEPASSLHFPEEDAYGDRPLPPVRKIGLGRQALTGLITSGRKSRGPAQFESSLERDYLVLLEFDPQVISWEPQPLSLTVPGADGRRASRYTPDVLVERLTPLGRQWELIEVKYWDEVRRTWIDLRRKFEAARGVCQDRGWRFRLATDKYIRRPRLYNAKFLLPYRDEDVEPNDVAAVIESLRAEEITTPARVVQRISKDTRDQLRFYPVLWKLMARHWIQWWPDYQLTPGLPIKLIADPFEDAGAPNPRK